MFCMQLGHPEGTKSYSILIKVLIATGPVTNESRWLNSRCLCGLLLCKVHITLFTHACMRLLWYRGFNSSGASQDIFPHDGSHREAEQHGSASGWPRTSRKNCILTGKNLEQDEAHLHAILLGKGAGEEEEIGQGMRTETREGKVSASSPCLKQQFRKRLCLCLAILELY